MEITPRIAVFDSGIGGTGVLAEIRARSPWADVVYVADRAFGAYGERSLDDVRARTALLAGYLVSAGVEMIAIACNSASAAALHHLREAVPEIPFVGMEPAVKPAVEATSTGVIAVLATGATFQGELFKALVGSHGDGVDIVEQACPGLAAAVEAGADVGSLLDEFLPPVAASGADNVVLGCTHYPLIASEIAERLPDGVALIDPAPAVAARVIDVARSHDIDLKGSGATLYWTTELHTPAESDWESVDIPEQAAAAVRISETSLSAVMGDITTMPVDAIVNAANVELAHGGGVAAAITSAGGPGIVEESNEWFRTYGPLEPGVAALTSAGDMPSTYVLHVAGPIYAPDQDNEALLAAAAYAALDLASDLEVASVAAPAVSAGIYGYPPDEATSVLAESAAEYLTDDETSIRSVRLVGFDELMTSRFASAIGGLAVEA